MTSQIDKEVIVMNIQQLKAKLVSNIYDSNQLQGMLHNYTKSLKDGSIKESNRGIVMRKVAIIKEYMGIGDISLGELKSTSENGEVSSLQPPSDIYWCRESI